MKKKYYIFDHLNHCVRQASIQGGEVADEKLAEDLFWSDDLCGELSDAQ